MHNLWLYWTRHKVVVMLRFLYVFSRSRFCIAWVVHRCGCIGTCRCVRVRFVAWSTHTLVQAFRGIAIAMVVWCVGFGQRMVGEAQCWVAGWCRCGVLSHVDFHVLLHGRRHDHPLRVVFTGGSYRMVAPLVVVAIYRGSSK